MALPSNAQGYQQQPQTYGVVLNIVPSSDPTLDIVVQRKATTGSTGQWATIKKYVAALGNSAGLTLTDYLPNSTSTFDYRGRHESPGFAPGPWTTTPSVGPTLLGQGAVASATPLSGQTIGADFFVSTGVAIKYGSGASPSVYSKTVTLHGSAMSPRSSTDAFKRVDVNGTNVRRRDGLAPGVTGVATTFEGALRFSTAILLRQISVTYMRGSTGDSLDFSVYRSAGSAATVDVWSYSATGLNSTAPGGPFVSYSSSDLGGDSAGDLVCRAVITRTSTAPSNASVWVFTVNYEASNLNQSL